jgi:UPF0716 family protein affecting phage T7 exclusion
MKVEFELNHYNVSMIKSGFRIAAGILLMIQFFVTAGLFLVIAELLGILEEMVEEKTEEKA